MLIGQILKELFGVSEEEIEKALQLQKELGGYIGQRLIQLGSITETQLIEALSKQLNIPIFKDHESLNLDNLSEELKNINLEFILENNVIPIKITSERIEVITNDPLKTYVFNYLSNSLNKPCFVFLAEERILKQVKQKITPQEEKEVKFIFERDIERLKDLASEAPVIKYLNDLISKAVELNASDIHFEPAQRTFKIRLRIDGVLHDFEELKEDFFLAVVSRIKLLSGLDIAEKRLPQDGKFFTRVGANYIDMRVSTIPSVKGEDVVVRLLYRGKLSFNLSDLGLEEDSYILVKEMIKNPYGIILVTGPTGSGKTTTLYSMLSALKTPEKKIITIEDPVEYQLDGITQIQVKPEIGLTFASALRSILRHDPDIIMVGEIRDTETAQIAIQSALTGHLVLSTLHTNDSISTLFRLLDMGIEDYLINASLIGIIAQRIIRTICPYCAQEIPLDKNILEEYKIDKILEKFKNLLENDIKTYKGSGCKFCLNTGFKGRIAIFEILPYEEELKEIFIKTRSITVLRDYLERKTNFRTLREDGIIKYLKGKTTLEEILRVT